MKNIAFPIDFPIRNKKNAIALIKKNIRKYIGIKFIDSEIPENNLTMQLPIDSHRAENTANEKIGGIFIFNLLKISF